MAGIYIHIPFCKQACHYCDFHFSTSLKMKDDFIKALLNEIALQKDFFDTGEIIETIYFGGGTPSLLDQKDLDSIFTAIHQYFNVAADAEITLEANPDDLTAAKLRMLYSTPVNRLSAGIQSFDDTELQWMNRAHNSQMALSCIHDAQAAGFENISVDLIYGSPVLSDEQWIKNLETAFAMQVPHLSCYSLTVEERTPLDSQIKKGISLPVDENKSAAQFSILMELAASHGFEQYEISNFCRQGKYSRHNSNYWEGVPYLGLGPSAHSFDGTARQWNIKNNIQYIRSIEKKEIPFTREVLSAENAYNEQVMIALRTSQGISGEAIEKRHGKSFASYFSHTIERYIADNSVEKVDGWYRLTMKGKYFADRIASDLFYIGAD
jgi:oxygen-independent coproporphyrinogen-3 oxidase